MRGIPAIGHRQLPEAGLARGGNSGRAGRGAAQEYLPLCRQGPQCHRTWLAVHPARGHPKQSGRGKGGGRLSPRRISRHGQRAGDSRAPALRRSGRDRRRPRSHAPVAQWAHHSLHRLGCRRASIRYRTTRNEETRCRFCKNACLRTFLDVRTGNADELDASVLPRPKCPFSRANSA